MPHAREDLVDIPRLHRRHRDDLLREHVERIARIARGFDLTLVHRARDCGAREEIAPKLREHDAFADGSGLMSRAADALKAAGDRGRRFDLHDEIDRAHIDAELQRRCGDQRADAAGFQQLFDFAAGIARHRAVVRSHERLTGELVQRARQSLGQPAAVDEEQRRLVRANELEKARMHRRPDRGSHGSLRRGVVRDLGRCRQPRHVFDRNLDAQRELLLLRGVDDRDGPVGDRLARAGQLVAQFCFHRSRGAGASRSGLLARRERGRAADVAPPRKRATSSSGRCVAERPMRCSGPPRSAAKRFETFERERQMCAALAGHEGMDLVDDDGVETGQTLARIRCQQQKQRFWRCDQDVGGLAAEPGAIARRRITRADRDVGHGDRDVSCACDASDAFERRSKIALDVDGERLERRHIEDAASRRSAAAPARTSGG